jgi:hypothetical protein
VAASDALGWLRWRRDIQMYQGKAIVNMARSER